MGSKVQKARGACRLDGEPGGSREPGQPGLAGSQMYEVASAGHRAPLDAAGSAGAGTGGPACATGARCQTWVLPNKGSST